MMLLLLKGFIWILLVLNINVFNSILDIILMMVEFEELGLFCLVCVLSWVVFIIMLFLDSICF